MITAFGTSSSGGLVPWTDRGRIRTPAAPALCTLDGTAAIVVGGSRTRIVVLRGGCSPLTASRTLSLGALLWQLCFEPYNVGLARGPRHPAHDKRGSHEYEYDFDHTLKYKYDYEDGNDCARIRSEGNSEFV